MIEPIFVYGILKPDVLSQINPEKLENLYNTWKRAIVKGRLYMTKEKIAFADVNSIGKEDSPIIKGFIVYPKSKEIVKEIDSIEKNYKKIDVIATTKNGEEVNCKMYVISSIKMQLLGENVFLVQSGEFRISL